MGIRKGSIGFLLGVMVGASLIPVVAGALVCTDGTAPDCCPVTADAPSAAHERQATLDEHCRCCIAIDAIPSAVGNSAQKRFLEALPAPADVAIVVARPPAPAAMESAEDGRDHSPYSSRSAVLRL